MRFYSGMNFSRSLLGIMTLAVLISSTLALAQKNGKYLFYVGTYTQEGNKSKGIYAYRYDAGTQEITSLGLAAETTNPSWIAIHPNGHFLYAVNEVQNYKGPNSGGVSAFSIDRATGKLTLLNEVASRGADPCYISVDKTGKYVLVANYTGGNIAAFPISEDGKLGEASAFVQHTGHGPNARRQRTHIRSICRRTIALPLWTISASTNCLSTSSTLRRGPSRRTIRRSPSCRRERARVTSRCIRRANLRTCSLKCIPR